MLKNTLNELKRLHSRLNGTTIEFDLSFYRSILEVINGKRNIYASMADTELQAVSEDLKKRAQTGESLELYYCSI